MSQRKILFDCRNWLCYTFDHPHRFFQEHKEYNIIPISAFHNELELKRFGAGKENIDLLINYWEAGKSKYDIKGLTVLEKKYGITNFWNIIYSDRFIKHWNNKKIVEQVSFYFYAWEKIIEKYKPDFVFNETVTGLWNYSLFEVAGYNSIPYLGMLPTKNTQKYYFTRDINGHFPEFEEAYKKILNKPLDEDERDKVIKTISEFRTKKIAPLHTKRHVELPRLSKILTPYKFLKDVVKDVRDYGLKDNVDYKIGLRTKGYPFELRRWYRTKFIFGSKIFKEPDYNEKYILFPLQFQPEATTEIWAAYYSNQLQLIDQIARSIPFDYVLYVKEHSHFLGTKPVDFYKKLSRLPNVKLINPLADIHKLVEKSKLIIVITATTGLEGIIWNKPVIIFGEVFYDFYPHLYNVKELNGLSETISEALNQKVDENDGLRLKFLSAYFRSGYDVNLFKMSFTDEEKNKIIKVILNEIERSGQKV